MKGVDLSCDLSSVEDYISNLPIEYIGSTEFEG